ncbi:MAG: DUF4142 domain-containing protein [Acidobacteriota bacterium]|nr:DUF4142 domain-containing protein [Acidobacteriota bacterium]
MNNTTEISSEDKEFMHKAAHAGHAEIKAGQMALSKTSSADVKKFAQRMIDDHTKAGDKLKELAASKNVTLPTEPSDEQKKKADELSKLSDEKFDAEYMDAQVSDHKKVIGFFGDETDDGADSDVIDFATNTLPTLKSHLEMAESINANL